MPFPNSKLVHPRFREQIQGSATGDRGLPDLGVIKRPGTGDGTTDAFGNWTPPASTTVYDDAVTPGVGAPCRVQAMPTDNRTVVIGEEVVTLHRYRVGIQADADQVLVDDVLTLTVSSDPQLIRRPLIVRAVNYDSFLGRRLLLCEDHPAEPTPEA